MGGYIRLGNQSATPGAAQRIRIKIASQTRKGKAAFATWNNVVPFGATPSITYSNNPKGGVVPAISMVISTKSPYQIRSNSSAPASGKKIGTVINIIDVASINIPSKISTQNIRKRII